VILRIFCSFFHKCVETFVLCCSMSQNAPNIIDNVHYPFSLCKKIESRYPVHLSPLVRVYFFCCVRFIFRFYFSIYSDLFDGMTKFEFIDFPVFLFHSFLFFRLTFLLMMLWWELIVPLLVCAIESSILPNFRFANVCLDA